MQQRASESIGALAAALAKAQIELVNPEKSLVATIREEGRHGREQTFRYAPLSAGLEITRKVLGHRDCDSADDLDRSCLRAYQSHDRARAFIGRMDRL